MSAVDPHAATRAGVGRDGAAAGALLCAAREASGLSIDAVAQQLKLAPRQVRALEAGEFGRLPGRTFVRGFIRSYARLVRLDPDEVLGTLPAGEIMPALEAPTLQPTGRAMGELPTTEERPKAGWMRWAIPLTLAAVVAAAAVYEWKRPTGNTRPAAKEAGVGADASQAAPALDKTETPLPNPLSGVAPVAEPSSAVPAAPSAPSPAEGQGTRRAP